MLHYAPLIKTTWSNSIPVKHWQAPHCSTTPLLSGLNNCRPFHGLRHAYASTLASSGKVDLYKLQKLLTHKSPLMTQRYAHLSNDALMEASNVISDLTKSHQNITDLDELKIGKGES